MCMRSLCTPIPVQVCSPIRVGQVSTPWTERRKLLARGCTLIPGTDALVLSYGTYARVSILLVVG
jgi:hypothetical protein